MRLLRAGNFTQVMMAEIRGSCFGVSMSVCCQVADASLVTAAFPPGTTYADSACEVDQSFCLEPSASRCERILSKSGDTEPAGSQPLEAAIRALRKELSWTVAERARGYAVVHAGVVALDDTVIILPGSSHDGKSTLVWSLVQAGATYYSDEYAVFDELGFVHPFPVPISLRGHRDNSSVVTPVPAGQQPALPSLVVMTHYERGARWKAEPQSPGEALMGLLRHSIGIRTNPQLVLQVLTKVATQSWGYSGVRGEAHQLVQWLSSIAANLSRFKLEKSRYDGPGRLLFAACTNQSRGRQLTSYC